MQYLVIWSDGNKYGPADLALLNQWAQDGRVFPDTELEPVDGSPRIKASDLPGLIIPSATKEHVVLTDSGPAPIMDDGDLGNKGAASLDPGSVSPIASTENTTPTTTYSATPVSASNPPTTSAEPPQYFVIGPGGTKYGPADAPTLVKWKAENRLNDTSELEDAATGQRLMAGSLPGMAAAAAPTYNPVSTYQQPTNPTGTPYAQAPQASGVSYGGVEPGKQEVTQSFIAAAVGFFCCPYIGPGIGLFLGFKAKQLGNKNAVAAIVVNFVVLGIELIMGLLQLLAIFAAMASTPTTR